MAEPDDLPEGDPLPNRSEVEAPARDAAPERGERSILKTYLNQIGQVPLLTPEQEVELAGRIRRGDKAARDHMITANLRLVVRIAQDYRDFGLPLVDLVSEGNLGLIKAVERFDPSKGGKLSTYAAWWIKQSIKRALANHSKTIRLPVHMVDKISRLRRLAAQLAEELEREPTDEELAEVSHIPIHKIAHYRSVSTRPASLDAPVGEGDDSARLGDLVGDESAVSPLETLREKSARAELHELLDALEPREAQILRLRFGFDGGDEMTLEDVGKHFRLTRERVRQLQHLALVKLRRAMAAREAQRTREDIAEERRTAGRQQVLREFLQSRLRAAS